MVVVLAVASVVATDQHRMVMPDDCEEDKTTPPVPARQVSLDTTSSSASSSSTFSSSTSSSSLASTRLLLDTTSHDDPAEAEAERFPGDENDASSHYGEFQIHICAFEACPSRQWQEESSVVIGDNETNTYRVQQQRTNNNSSRRGNHSSFNPYEALLERARARAANNSAGTAPTSGRKINVSVREVSCLNLNGACERLEGPCVSIHHSESVTARGCTGMNSFEQVERVWARLECACEAMSRIPADTTNAVNNSESRSV